jgi:hypothetical protein
MPISSETIVERDRRSSGHADQPGACVEILGAAGDQPRIRVAGKPHQVHLERFAGVVAGDQTRQHSGIGRDGIGIDQRQPHARQRAHRPVAQNERMGVPAAQKHQIARGGEVGHRVSVFAPDTRGARRRRDRGTAGNAPHRIPLDACALLTYLASTHGGVAQLVRAAES